MKDRALGTFVGLAIGDALGSVVEFLPRDTYEPVTGFGRSRTWRAGTTLGQMIMDAKAEAKGQGPFNLLPGEWTDDTSQALCLAESLLIDPNLDQKDFMDKISDWESKGYNSVKGYCFDCGATTMDAIDRYRETRNPVAGNLSPSSAGNGCIMRLSPVATRWWNDIAKAMDVAVRQSVVTHRAPQCLAASSVLAWVLAGSIQKGVKNYDRIAKNVWHPAINEIVSGSYKVKTRAQIKSSGYVVDTLEAALWAVYNTVNFKDAVLLAVNLGNDSDTVGAVTGQIAGALYGLSGIPEDWVNELAWKDKILDLANQLYEAGKNG